MCATVRIVRLRLHHLYQWWRWQGLRIALLPGPRPSAHATSANATSANATGTDTTGTDTTGTDADTASRRR